MYILSGINSGARKVAITSVLASRFRFPWVEILIESEHDEKIYSVDNGSVDQL